MGGPVIPWRPGRTDADDGSKTVPDGRLPDASQGAAHIREVFGRMGFNDEEMVALIGAHALGQYVWARTSVNAHLCGSQSIESQQFEIDSMHAWSRIDRRSTGRYLSLARSPQRSGTPNHLTLNLTPQDAATKTTAVTGDPG